MKKKFVNEQFNREEIKKRGFRRFLNSWKFSIQGLTYAYKYEQSMLIHFVATISAVILGMLLRISAMEWLLIFLSLGVVLAMELINTAIEAVVDMVTLEIHPLAKIAKDCGSAATFVVSILTAVVSLAIYVPRFIELVK